MALLFSYGIDGFINLDPGVKSNYSLIALMWLVVAIVEFFGYGFYAWSFGFASERMVVYLPTLLTLGSTSETVIIPSHLATKCRVLRSRRSFYGDLDPNARSGGDSHVRSIRTQPWRYFNCLLWNIFGSYHRVFSSLKI
jgi:hypothetical protein